VAYLKAYDLFHSGAWLRGCRLLACARTHLISGCHFFEFRSCA